ncbi:MAG: hypothetical protein JXB10_18215 [Pirellulales bacterium]|nr:hypothetical protein [Pirellulales bacterium]
MKSINCGWSVGSPPSSPNTPGWSRFRHAFIHASASFRSTNPRLPPEKWAQLWHWKLQVCETWMSRKGMDGMMVEKSADDHKLNQ